MRNLPYKINDLSTEGQHLGTDSDNADFRGEINSQQKTLEDHIASVYKQIQNFSSIQVEYKDEKKLKDKSEAFNNSFNDMAVKFKSAKKHIEEKMKQNMEFGKRRRQASQMHHSGSSGAVSVDVDPAQLQQQQQQEKADMEN